MFRIHHVAGFISKTIRPAVILRSQNSCVQSVCMQRYYSKNRDDKPGSKEKKGLTSKSDGECDPYRKETCEPPTPSPPKKLPYLEDCPPPPKKKLPDDCEEDAADRSKYLRRLLLGLLFTAAALGAMYYFSRPHDVKKKKVIMKKDKKKKRIILKDPSSSRDIPNSVPYLLIGGGTASFSAFRAIKSTDPQAKVLVITNEGFFPYMRPPLSKEMWFNDDAKLIKNLTFKQWNGSERSLFYEPDDFYMKCQNLMDSENGGVAIARGWHVKSIDVINKTVQLEDNYEIQYDKCLIATGALPRNLEVFEQVMQDPKMQEKVTVYRNIYDFEDLYEEVEKAKSVVIIGGGFLGSELACCLSKKGKSKKTIYQIFRESGNMGKILPEYLSSWTTEKVKSEGVEVIPNSEVIGVDVKNRQIQLTLSGGKTISADHVVVAIGAEPNTEFAENSGLEVDPDLGGYVVNTELQARSHLYVAGDCACFYDTKFGRRRVEHHDHAVVTGRLAGENMTGAAKPYLHQSMFWSDLGPDVGYEAIGIVDSSLPTVGVFAKATDKDNPKAVVTATDEGIRSKTEEIPQDCKKYVKDEESQKLAKEVKMSENAAKEGEDYGKGVIFYLRDDIVVGIVLWNVFNRMSVARQVLKDDRKYEDLNEVAKLFNIHED